MHTGEKPYQCATCLRSFSRLDALNRHRKTETACLKSNQLKPIVFPSSLPNPGTFLLEPTTQPTSSASLPTNTIKLPSLVIHENIDEIERLKQRIHDLEIEVCIQRCIHA